MKHFISSVEWSGPVSSGQCTGIMYVSRNAYLGYVNGGCKEQLHSPHEL